MLKPAICYKEEIESALKEYFYTDDMMYYTGWIGDSLIKVNESNDYGDIYQYAVTGKENKLIGYISYRIDRYSSCAYNFGAFSFDRGNPIMGMELYKLIEELISTLHRVEFRAISCNPATKSYDRLFEKHINIAYKHVLKDVFKDKNGLYHDEYIYEFVHKWGT